MPIEPSQYIDVVGFTPTEPSPAEPVKVKEEPQEDKPFHWKEFDTTEVIDLDDFPSDDDERSYDHVQTEDTLLASDDEEDIITARQGRRLSRANIHSVESDSEEITICAPLKDGSLRKQFETGLEEMSNIQANVKENDDQFSDWDPEGTPEPAEGANIDDLDDRNVSIQMRDADEETRHKIRMYIFLD